MKKKERQRQHNMTRLLRSKSCGLVGFTAPPPQNGVVKYNHHHRHSNKIEVQQEQQEEAEHEQEEEEKEEEFDYSHYSHYDPEYQEYDSNATPFISQASRFVRRDKQGGGKERRRSENQKEFAIVDVLVSALRKSLVVTCSTVERDDHDHDQSDVVPSSFDISCPTDVQHLSHVTFDRFHGFLGLPSDLLPDLPSKVPSASANVFGVSAESMQCSYDDRGNSVPTILLLMQRRLYVEGGLKAEGIFRINAENSQEEYVRNQLNKGIVPRGIDVHCLAGLIKAWFRELPCGVLDSPMPEQLTHCNTEDDCTQLVKLLPPTESALLNWAINLMADVVEHEYSNKMNARNVAMVFAPNMTQMKDPLTALIHAVQVMNLLKTMILKTLRERDARTNRNDSCQSNFTNQESHEEEQSSCAPPTQHDVVKFMSYVTMARQESKNTEGYECSPRSPCEIGGVNSEEWLSLKRGVRKLSRHPVFQLNKPGKKTRILGFVNTRGASAGGQAWS